MGITMRKKKNHKPQEIDIIISFLADSIKHIYSMRITTFIPLFQVQVVYKKNKRHIKLSNLKGKKLFLAHFYNVIFIPNSYTSVLLLPAIVLN
jgi:hypothetical protein